ncbi:MAG: hypothetical protein CFE21_04525 [Bacteroidetes bacterium B1(2017)]|nr:MAG: hypothetical protein CFE21_04525 [Bacteroidetes bacterium B1(2017)]
MKKTVLIAALLLTGLFSQAQLRFGFTNPLDLDNWNHDDDSAGVELAVWTPNNDTLTFSVGADITAINGTAVNGVDFNFAPQKCTFLSGTNIYDRSNQRVLKYNFTPNTTTFGERDFYIKLGNLVGCTTSNLSYGRDLMRVIIDFNGSGVGIKKLSAHSYRLFPIPATTNLFIEGVNPSSYKVYDLAGRLASEGDVMQNSINVSELSNGLYVLYAQTDKGLIVQKFLKQ